MSGVLENLLVALLVAGSALYSAWRLMPPATRLKLLEHLIPLLGGTAAAPLVRLRSKVVAQLAGGCAACSVGGALRHRAARR